MQGQPLARSPRTRQPLSFLDHQIRVGNSLLGATPELITAGIPDDAFTAIEGDDKKASSPNCASATTKRAQASSPSLAAATEDADIQAIAAAGRRRDRGAAR